ncbi:MAG: hypothetical protein Q8T11_11105 [Elusimicrobiota bacterium]|nr:hypothetical protein [Elusimicrobiota bacterium]
MKPLILAAMLVWAAPAAAAPEPAAPAVQADWRRDGVDERIKAGLTSLGWRLEDDGRALDPKTKSPAAKAVLDKAVLDLRQDARRAALESLNLMLDPNRPAEFGDDTRKQLLAQDLPPGLAAAVLDPDSDLSKTRAMAVAELDKVAAYFDGGRTMADRRAAAQPVSAGTPGPRVDLPYHTVLERSVGEKLQASARAEIGRDPFGRTVLSRLDAAGKPDLPPILVEDQGGGIVARYDYRRRAVVLDREGVLASVTGTVPPRQAAALRASLSTRAALLAYLEAHPEAVEAVVKDNDVLLVHELTHAWQDRRDPVFREMARGNIPDVQPLEYEEEAYKTKNLYIRSKLKHDPASVKMNDDFDDYVMMTHGLGSWRRKLFDDIETAAPARALTLKSTTSIEAARLARVRARSVATSEEQQAKALDLLGLNRGQKELAKLEAAHAKRMAALDPEIEGATTASFKDLGSYYLVQALTATRAPDRMTFLEKAGRYARASGDNTLIEEVRKAKEQTQ